MSFNSAGPRRSTNLMDPREVSQPRPVPLICAQTDHRGGESKKLPAARCFIIARYVFQRGAVFRALHPAQGPLGWVRTVATGLGRGVSASAMNSLSGSASLQPCD